MTLPTLPLRVHRGETAFAVNLNGLSDKNLKVCAVTVRCRHWARHLRAHQAHSALLHPTIASIPTSPRLD